MLMLCNLKEKKGKKKKKKEQIQERAWKQSFMTVVQMCCFSNDRL